MEYIPLCKEFYTDKSRFNELYFQRYNSEYAVHLDFSVNGNDAFFLLVPSLFQSQEKLFHLDKQVKVLSDALPGKALEQFATRCLIDEIVLTNDIEGVYSSRKEIQSVLFELKENNKRNRYYGLVQKYLMLQSKEQISIHSCQDIRDLYNELVYNEIRLDNPINLPDGKIFRKESTSVLSVAQKEIHRGVYPEGEIINCMNKALSVLHNDSIAVFFRIAIFHYLFGYIHPFYDGNGRTSRFISSYLLAKEFEPVLGYRISYTIREHLNDYYNAFKLCNDIHSKGDLTPFVLMFTDIVIRSMQQLVNALEKRYNALNYYLARIPTLPNAQIDKYANLYNLLIQASLFSEDGISTPELLEVLSVSRSTLSKRLKDGIRAGVICQKSIGNTHFFSADLNAIDKRQTNQSS
ncbi:MAG: Fic family protein [Clostridiales bacterium]|nr:Fic family protein [Clostridiales bacterium]